MKVCAISFKECWQDAQGVWLSDGGFPLQMSAISTLFDQMTLLITRVPPRAGGMPLPQSAKIVPVRRPVGSNARRKLDVVLRLPYYTRALVREMRTADVVHVPLPGDIPFLGMLAALCLRKRLLARYGGSWNPTSQTTWMNRVTRWCMRCFAGGRNVMLVTGEGSLPPSRRAEWIFATALSQAELASVAPDLDRNLSNPPQLAYVGRLSPEKGVENLIRALSQLKSKGFQCQPKLTIIGDGPERIRLEHMVDNVGSRPLVEFTGQLPRSELSRRLQRADLCVQPSLTEGFSKAWLDAMAHGLPVIASEVGAARSVVGEAGERGWVTPPGNVPALAAALESVLRGPVDWPALRRRCRRYVECRTLEAWSERIGRLCAERWGWSLVDGKLTA
jgi:glycosyltransferase involved in cell wall biosynthesis